MSEIIMSRMTKKDLAAVAQMARYLQRIDDLCARISEGGWIELNSLLADEETITWSELQALKIALETISQGF